MFELAAIFKDHMVVQREKPITVFGTGTPGEKLRITLSSSKAVTAVKSDGTWGVSLHPLSAGEGYELKASSAEHTITIQDVAVGEVWLDGGQSNMELALNDSENGIEIAQSYIGDKLRYYQVPKCAVLDNEQQKQARNSAWHIADKYNVGRMSAVAFYFAQKLASRMDCVIGIIDCYWGGTSVSCWMSNTQLEKLVAGQKLISDFKLAVGDKTEEQYMSELKAYRKSCNDWIQRTDNLRREHPDISWCEIHERCGNYPWPEPIGWQSPFRPNGLYETMIKPVAPYTLRGFIYYQGEEDVQRYSCYCDMMQLLVQQWRSDWNDWNLPFLFVQLAMYTADGEEDDRSWAFQREQQLFAAKSIQNSGMVSIADCGEYDNVHPVDKKTPGERLATLAQEMVYQNKTVKTPTADYIYSDGKKLFICFTPTTEKLILRDTERPAFEIAGMDGAYVPAQVSLLEGNILCAQSEKVDTPQALRYAWYNYGEATLFTEGGTTISPFRKTIYNS